MNQVKSEDGGDAAGETGLGGVSEQTESGKQGHWVPWHSPGFLATGKMVLLSSPYK